MRRPLRETESITGSLTHVGPLDLGALSFVAVTARPCLGHHSLLPPPFPLWSWGSQVTLASLVLVILPRPCPIWPFPRILTPELGGNRSEAPLCGWGVMSVGTQSCLQPHPLCGEAGG